MTEPNVLSGETKVRLTVLDLEGKVLGNKIDTFWNLSPDEHDYKEHSLENAGPDGSLAGNLRYIFDMVTERNSAIKNSWFNRHQDGVIISVQDVSPNNFSSEIMRYRIVKQGDEYVVASD